MTVPGQSTNTSFPYEGTELPSVSSQSGSAIHWLGYSPLRDYALQPELREKLSFDHSRILVALASRLRTLLPVLSLTVKRTSDGDLLVLACVPEGDPSADEALSRLEEVDHWLEDQNLPEPILVDIRRH